MCGEPPEHAPANRQRERCTDVFGQHGAVFIGQDGVGEQLDDTVEDFTRRGTHESGGEDCRRIEWFTVGFGLKQ